MTTADIIKVVLVVLILGIICFIFGMGIGWLADWMHEKRRNDNHRS